MGERGEVVNGKGGNMLGFGRTELECGWLVVVWTKTYDNGALCVELWGGWGIECGGEGGVQPESRIKR